MRIDCLTTGAVRIKQGERGAHRYLSGGWRDETMPVNVFLVEHPAGLCLFDAGQTALAAKAGYFPHWYPFFRLSRFELSRQDEAAEQLRRGGTPPESVRWLVLSHLHTDHVGGVASFPKAEIVVSRTEWDRAQGFRGRLRGYLPQYWPAGSRPRLVDFDGPPLGPFSGSYDLAGDGRLVLVPTPGHTAGHMSLLVRDGDRGFLLGGDVAHTAAELESVAPAIAAFCRSESFSFLAAHDSGADALVSDDKLGTVSSGGQT